VEFGSKIISVNDKQIKLQIWDTAGQETFKSITRSYYRGSIGVILVYDITNRDSFNNIMKWLDETKNYANDKVTMLLVGNKTDLDSKYLLS
jgi:Ras-related protein Rab-2A